MTAVKEDVEETKTLADCVQPIASLAGALTLKLDAVQLDFEAMLVSIVN